MSNAIFNAHIEFGRPCGDAGLESIADWGGDVILEQLKIIKSLVSGITAWAHDEDDEAHRAVYDAYRRALEFLERQENEKEGGE